MTAHRSSLCQMHFQEGSLTLASQHRHVNPSDHAHGCQQKNTFATEVLFCYLKCSYIDCSEMEKKQLPEMPVKWLRNLK